jgi:2-amino-4-hydroxy-6-hydroxymethyldihydropteridine diphosphokinase
MVCRITTDLSAEELLHLAKEIEREMGRVPDFPNSPRPIDIDILFYHNHIIKTKNLTSPHPRLTERAFALIPLAESAPEVVHPELGKSIAELADLVRGKNGVQKRTGGLNV